MRLFGENFDWLSEVESNEQSQPKSVRTSAVIDAFWRAEGMGILNQL